MVDTRGARKGAGLMHLGIDEEHERGQGGCVRPDEIAGAASLLGDATAAATAQHWDLGGLLADRSDRRGALRPLHQLPQARRALGVRRQESLDREVCGRDLERGSESGDDREQADVA